MAFTDLHEGVAEEFAQASGRGREWFDAEGFDTRRLPRIRNEDLQGRLAVLMNKRWEAKNPERAKALHRKAAAEWKRRDPEGFRAKRNARKKRYRQRHPDRITAQNRANYLNWAAKPGNLEAARERAANRRRQQC